ncbi:cobalamin B12-binding domain-containing protein [Parasphingopyxis sp.]|uniref:cobalamin B12-binding domain-containing protein n=1 Tax=Parasphingopyxis sp. TaxID=1920299 RepID=UPI00261182C4|nr:cobalamin B12-binding domain-containing protein [Parasphingopyxis sp.]
MASLMNESSTTQPIAETTTEETPRPKARERRPNTAKPPANPERINSLIESQIIPRLVAAHSPETTADHFEPITEAEIAHFAPLPIILEADELLAEVETLLARGVPPEAIFVDLLAPSARHLGEMWEEDSVDFVEVTMGLWRLQEVMREIAARTPSIAGRLLSPRSIMVAPLPGEQHSFGAVMLEEFFARAGWDTELMVNSEGTNLTDRLSEKSFDLLGLTVSCDCHIGPLPKFIHALRSISKNADIRIMIGGRVPNEHPGLAEEAGADGTASSASTAIEVADELVAEFVPMEARAG